MRSALEEFYKMSLLQVMKKTGFATLPKDTPIEDVLETLIDFSHIWVTEFRNSGRVVGVITRKDFLDMALPPHLSGKSVVGSVPFKSLYYDGAMITAADMMTREVTVLKEDTSVADTLGVMKSDFLRQVPIVRDGEISGEVSMRDLIRIFIETFKHVRIEEEKNREGTTEC